VKIGGFTGDTSGKLPQITEQMVQLAEIASRHFGTMLDGEGLQTQPTPSMGIR
jgi:Tfp pilus assembly protein PilP